MNSWSVFGHSKVQIICRDRTWGRPNKRSWSIECFSGFMKSTLVAQRFVDDDQSVMCWYTIQKQYQEPYQGHGHHHHKITYYSLRSRWRCGSVCKIFYILYRLWICECYPQPCWTQWFTYLSNTHSLLASRVLSCVRHDICTNESKVKAAARNMACVMVSMLHTHAKGSGRGECVCVCTWVCMYSVSSHYW